MEPKKRKEETIILRVDNQIYNFLVDVSRELDITLSELLRRILYKELWSHTKEVLGEKDLKGKSKEAFKKSYAHKM